MIAKKAPVRMCAGCSEHKEKKQLIRIVKTPEGEILLDTTGKQNGRGAYLCHNLECLKKARKSRRLEKALSCQIPQEVYDRLEGELKV